MIISVDWNAVFYLEWNEALYHYYFPKGAENVILYVDDEILKKIGKSNLVINHECEKSNNDDKYIENFLEYVLNKNIEKIKTKENIRKIKSEELACQKKPTEGTKEYNSSLIDAYKKLIKYESPSYLAYIIAILYAAKDNISHEGINDFCKKIIKGVENKSSNSSIGNVFGELMQALKDAIPAVNDGMVGSLTNISRIKFHLVLTTPMQNVLRRLLYKRNIKDWNENDGIPYEQLRDDMLRELNGKKDNTDLVSLLDPQNGNEAVIKSFISKYNCEKDDELKTENIDIEGHFYYTLDFDQEDNPTFGLFVDINLDKNYLTNGLYIGGSEMLYEGWYPVGSNDSIEWKVDRETYLDNNKFHIRVQELPYYLFEALDVTECHYRQVPNNKVYSRSYSYLVVTKETKWNKLKINAQSPIDVTENYKSYFGNDWYVFYVKEMPIAETRAKGKDNRDNIDVVDGIKSIDGNYYPYGLPLIHAESVKESDIIVFKHPNTTNKKIEVRKLKNNTSDYYVPIYEQIFPENVVSTRYDVYIGGKPLGNGSWAIGKALEDKFENNRKYFAYDGFGSISNPNTDDVFVNNSVINQQAQQNGNQIRPPRINIDETYFKDDYNKCGMQLIWLLTAKYNEKESLSDNEVNRIIKYVAKIAGIKLETCRYVKYHLMDLGYMNRSFDEKGKELYQMNKWQIVKSLTADPKNIRSGNNLMMIYGSYIYDEYKRFENKLALKYVRPYTDDEKNKHPELALLPDFILFEDNNELDDDFLKGHNKSDNSLGRSYINLAKNISLFEETFINNNNNIYNNQQGNSNCYPCVVRDCNGVNWLWISKDKKVSRYNNSFINRTLPIPTDLMKLYCQYEHKLPVAIMDSNGREMYLTENMGLPFLFKKALCMMNLRIEGRIFAFPVYNCISQRNPNFVYVELKHYSISDCYDVLIQKMSGKRNNAILTYNADYFKLNFTRYNNSDVNKRNYILVLYRNTKIECCYISSEKQLYYNNGQGFCIYSHNDINTSISDVICKDIKENYLCKNYNKSINFSEKDNSQIKIGTETYNKAYNIKIIKK